MSREIFEKIRAFVATLVVAVGVACAWAAPDPLVPGAAKVDPVRQAAWNAANNQAKGKIDKFDAAVKSGNPDVIRKATLDLQADPIAVQQLNNSGRKDLVQRHNAETGTIKEATKQNIKQEMADRWNAENPRDPITPDDVHVAEPTNYKSPDAEPRVGQDWDVTVKVRGKDVPTSKSQSVVEDSYFKAAGGEDAFGKGATAKDVAHKQSIEVTDSSSLESYKEPEKILGTKDTPPDAGSRVKDPQDLGNVIEYKSNLARNKADAARAAGNPVEAVRQDFEQMRQTVKQYDKITDPRVKAQGGKVNSHVDKGMAIMRDVANMKISPEEGRALLAAMGETPDSMTRKAAGQVEAAQKLKPPDAPKTTAPDAPKGVVPDAPKGVVPDAPKGVVPDAPKGVVPDAPKGVVPDAPKGVVPDAPKGVVPDAPKGVVPDAPKGVVPDAPKGVVPDAPKASAPDVPSGKVGKALKVLNTAGDVVDVFGNAQDFKEAAKKGDTEGMKTAVVNTADSVTGGFYGTTKVVGERATAAGEYVEEVSGLDKTMENARQGQITGDLRKAGYTKEQADKMVSDMAAGNDSSVKDAYGKMGKEVPKADTAGPSTVGEAAGIYVDEVKENFGEVASGMKTQAIKAGTFIKETGEDLTEIATGVTEKGVAGELITQVGENVSGGNLGAGYDTWQEGKKAAQTTEEGRKALEDRFVSKGATRAEAKDAADRSFGIGTETGKSDKTAMAALNKKLRERKEKNLKNAEGKSDGEGDEEDEDDEGEGGLKGFKDKRVSRVGANAESSYDLMGENENMSQASKKGDRAAADAKQAVSAAGADAQTTKDKAAAAKAAADREQSLGKAIADGVEEGVKTGASSFGSSFGKTAGAHVSDQIFDDRKKGDGKGKGKGKGEDGGVGSGPAGGKPGGGKTASKGSGKGGRKKGDGKPGSSGDGNPGDAQPADGEAPEAAAPPPKPKTKQVKCCRTCGSVLTYKGIYYADGTEMYSCGPCKSTVHDVGTGAPWTVKEVPDEPPPPAPTPVSGAATGSTTAPSAPAAGTASPPSTPPSGVAAGTVAPATVTPSAPAATP